MSSRCGVLILAAMLAAASAAHGQTPAELRAQSTAMQARRAESYQRMLDAQDAARTTPDDSLVVQGAIVRFRAAHLTSRERATVVRAFDAAARELNATFGAEGATLLAGEQWLLWFTEPRVGPRVAAFELISRTERLSALFAGPLRASAVQHLVVTRGATSAVLQSPDLAMWIGHNFAIDDVERTHYFAYRQLVLHASDASRRCARGVVNDCARTHGVAVAQSVLRYAIERDGPAVLRLLQRAPVTAEHPTATVAAALGESEEAFLQQWHARIAASGATRAKGTSGMLFTSLGWCALFAVAASRRRPR